MVLGTSSGAGKSLMTAALCRVLHRRGEQPLPFKGQNMSNNAWVDADGGEMAYSQAMQAWAAGLEPCCAMNPVLLKPRGDSTSEVIHGGTSVGLARAEHYYRDWFRPGWQAIREGLQTLQQRWPDGRLVLEGAGSPVEVNLQRRDLTNLRLAQYLRANCLLVADIERGGVFAQSGPGSSIFPSTDAGSLVDIWGSLSDGLGRGDASGVANVLPLLVARLAVLVLAPGAAERRVDAAADRPLLVALPGRETARPGLVARSFFILVRVGLPPRVPVLWCQPVLAAIPKVAGLVLVLVRILLLGFLLRGEYAVGRADGVCGRGRGRNRRSRARSGPDARGPADSSCPRAGPADTDTAPNWESCTTRRPSRPRAPAPADRSPRPCTTRSARRAASCATYRTSR